jgi:acetyl/propionyl-CoA carboxylase alpha subunit
VHPSSFDPPAAPPSRRPGITRLLVADRGEIARRIFRTAREMGIATVAVFTEVDRGALFVTEADEALALDRLSDRGPGSYLDAPAVVEAARRAGADAVHPGCGSLAEDPGLAWRCAEAGLAFVGPSPEAIATMGSKLEAKAVAAAAGVPVLAAEEVDGYPPGKLEAAAEVLGWPVLVKASAGGGGRGMRVVREGDDLVGAVESARREAVSTFGCGTVFLEPWLDSPRHVEVQLFGDATGRVVHLFERDCSLQRRRRKVIEEAPAPRLGQPLRERLLAAATAVAEAVRYMGAGTAEFLVSGEQFWFLDMDTRLQAEHPVTEAVLGLDLVRMQLAAAEGRPLPVEARHCTPSGHAVEARLYAEDPADGYRPQAGVLRRFEIDPAPALRVEAAVASGSVVGSHYDPLLAKVVAHATTRAEAIRRLAAALEGMRIHGLRTNRDQLVAALRHPEFMAGEVDTGLLERHHAALCVPRGGEEAVRLHAVAAALAAPPARRNDPSPRQSAAFRGPRGERIEVGYRTDPTGGVEVEVDGEALPGLRVGAVGPDAVDLEVDGRRRQIAVSRAGPGDAAGDAVVDVDSVLGHTELVVIDPLSGC